MISFNIEVTEVAFRDSRYVVIIKELFVSPVSLTALPPGTITSSRGLQQRWEF